MRLAFWRTGEEEAQAAMGPWGPVPAFGGSAAVGMASEAPVGRGLVATAAGDLDLRLLGEALSRRRKWIIGPTILAALLSIVAVNLISPRYRSEARILIDGRENVFLRPSGERSEERTSLDPEAVTSQVQLVLSRDLAREIIRKNKLAERPEFDPVLQGVSPLKHLLALVGVVRDPFSMTPEERVLDAYFDRLTAYAVDKSRVIVVEFQSRDPELAARVANSIADGYLILQQNARQAQARSASQWLSGEIDSLRRKVADAESRAEDFRSKSSLFIGTNNTTLSNQQMGELNTQLNNARALKSDAENKARLIREMLQSGKPIEASEVLNSELMRRLSEQRVTLRAQLAEQYSTLLDNHPRIKELRAQLADLDHQIRDEASKTSRSLDTDARIAGGRVESLSASLDQLKKLASSSNGQDVQLRALEREAKAQRDLLESYLAKFREANTRETIDAAPADGRIISRAIVSNTPAYPKKLPVVLLATLVTFLLSTGVIVTGALLRMTAPRAATAVVHPNIPARPDDAIKTVKFEPTEATRAAEPARALDPLPPGDDPLLPGDTNHASELEQLARALREAGEPGQKVAIIGTAAGESVTFTALTLARLLASQARVVLVDLAAFSPLIYGVSVDPEAPGLAELMLGEASFAQVITKDRRSRVQLIAAGRPGFDRALLQSPRLSLAVDALSQVYDHVLLDAGTASDVPADLLTSKSRIVVVPDAAMSEDDRALMRDQLKAAGVSEVTMLSEPAARSEVDDCQPSAAAA
jgi:polysaccharide biosynthesis transport protein